MGVLKRIIYMFIAGLTALCMGLSAYALPGNTRTGNFLLYKSGVLSPIVCNKRDGNTFYGTDGGTYTYASGDSAVEPFDINDQLQLTQGATLYSQPFSAFSTGTTIGAGIYTTTQAAGHYMYIKTSYGDGWVNDKYTKLLQTSSNVANDSAYGMAINTSYMMPSSLRNNYAMKPLYVTIHNTGNTASSAGALSHAKLQYNGNTRDASWHFTVDYESIYQSIPCNEQAGHAGDSTLAGNASSLSIEICENSTTYMKQAEDNAAKLAAALLSQNGLGIDRLVMHNTWSGKDCPTDLIQGTRNSMGWSAFRERVNSYLTTGTAPAINNNSTTVTAPKKETIASLKAGKKKLTVKYKKISGCSYQVSVKKSGSSWKYYSTSATSKTVTGLSRKKKYSVRVRAKKSDKYGSWSTTRTVKVK